MRKILHVDMDAFFAAVEQRDDPSLRGKPIAVGSGSDRGVVMTASYEARPFGVRSAMPSAVAKRLCPGLLFVPARMDAYREASQIIRALFHEVSDQVEPLSLDEAYLDVTEAAARDGSATAVARRLKDRIKAETDLTASAGLSVNKFLAKLASDMDKPDGLTVIRPEEVERFIDRLPVGAFHGVGPVTERRLQALGIMTGKDLKERSRDTLTTELGRQGERLWRLARGIDDRDVEPERIRRSIGAERTFGQNLSSVEAMTEALEPIAQKLETRLAGSDLRPRTLTLKMKDDLFRIQTRSRTDQGGLPRTGDAFWAMGRVLLSTPAPPGRPVRLLGLSLSNFRGLDEGEQLVFEFLNIGTE